MKSILSMFMSLLFVVSGFSVPDSNFKVWVDRFAVNLVSENNFTFESLDASQTAVSQAEKDECRRWFNENLLFAGGNGKAPAYNFSVGFSSLRDNLQDWTFSVGEESEEGAVYSAGKTSYITVSHKLSDIVATVEATIYEDNASCEWTVYIKNTGDENSPVIRKFHAVDSVLPTGSSTDAYFSQGAFSEADDFEPHKVSMSFAPLTFTSNGGRSESFLPYFNLHGSNTGIVLAVGWTGQWYTRLHQQADGVHVKAKQEDFSAYLTPDEEVRSPMISLTFYDCDNAVKGFNSFRNFTMDCIFDESARQVTTSGIGVETPGTDNAVLLQRIAENPPERCALIDFYWVDAGWYPVKTSWYDSVGNWYADPEKYPDGFGEAAALAESTGIEWLLWYEPERCCKGTDVYNECISHEGWLITQDDETNMVNLANEDCLEYITQLIVDSLQYNGVKCFRLDSNFTYLPLWEKADKMWCDGRKGITENHYVTNLYRFLDTILEEVDGIMIDSCASGGKRIDIEMCKRSIPLWRSDYNCADGNGNAKEDILQATQLQTYGLSLWVPYNGTCAYVKGEYADRTNIISCSQILEYHDIRHYMTGNYYPLSYGGMNTSKYHAMQFDKNAAEGMALIYKREDVKESSYTLKLNGLDSDATYEIYDYDNPDEKSSYTGRTLMTQGITLTINETPKAVIMMYSIAQGEAE